ncbi:MAG: hypothetical protein JXA99_05725 [Candidatus Lokiarchaeota archaeon]|nr:hypothetical protein [Candidatus Lokiarchaeota archaeon]
MRLLFDDFNKNSESFSHKVIKTLLYNNIILNNNNILESSLEKYFKNRIADIYFKFVSGEEVVIEVQNSYISIKELIDRTLDYNKKNIFVLWILNGKGNCVGSIKEPFHKKNVKISSIEKFLHKIYGGRVYYINVIRYPNKTTITKPFALHFSPVNMKKERIYKNKFRYYYLRNANVCQIPDWNILCNNYKFKLARFYDKNAYTTLKLKILKIIREFQNNRIKKDIKNKNPVKKNFKNMKKFVNRKLYNEYGKILILKAINDLFHENNNL